MKKRSKENSKYWERRMIRLFTDYPETKKVGNRYVTLKVLLQEKYPFIKEHPSFNEMLKDALFLDRKIRWMTEGEETDLKQTLSSSFVREHVR